MKWYSVFRILEYKPGCVDYEGSVYAESLAAAEMIAGLMHWCGPGERLDVELDTEWNGRRHGQEAQGIQGVR